MAPRRSSGGQLLPAAALLAAACALADDSTSPSPTPNCFPPLIALTGTLMSAITDAGVGGSYAGNTEDGGNAAFSRPQAAGFAPLAGWSCADVGVVDATLEMPVGPKHALEVNLGAGVAPGGTLTVDLCGANTLFDTMLFVGDGCPANATTFRCRGASDDACSQQSSVTIEGLGATRVYVIVGGYNGAFGPYSLQWSYVPPTPSWTSSPSTTSGATATGTRSSTQGASVSVSPPPTPSASQAPTAPGTSTTTPSAASTPRVTPSATETAGICGSGESGSYLTARLDGLSGVFDGALSGQAPLFPYGNCPDGAGGFALIKNAAQQLFSVDLGLSPPSDGFWQFDTCNGTDFDTLLFVGANCPRLGAFSQFGCLAMNDDACGVVVDDRTINSRVLLPVVPGARYMYVMVNAYAGTVSGRYQLRWQWLPEPPPGEGAGPDPDDPELSPSPSPTAARTPSSSPSLRPTPSGTPTARRLSFEDDSLLLVKLGGPAYTSAAPGTALPVRVVEVNPSNGAERRTLDLPTSGDDVAHPCVLSFGDTDPAWLYEQEGLPTLSADGGAVTFPCYAQPPGAPLRAFDDKVVAVVEWGGYADTSTGFFGFNGAPNSSLPQALRTAASVGGVGAGAGFYVGGVGGTALYHGLRWLAAGAYNPEPVSGRVAGHPGFADVRCLRVINGVLHGSTSAADGPGVSGVFAFNGSSGLPTSYAGGAFASLPGFAGLAPMSPFSWVLDGPAVETSTSMWVAVEHGRPAYNAVRFARDGATGVWAEAPGDRVLFSATQPVYSLAGRRSNATGTFLLFATTRSALYRYDTGTRAPPTALATAAPGEHFRGVALAPGVPGVPSPSPTNSLPPGATPSGTGTATRSAAATPSVTASATPPPTGTPSRSGTASPTSSLSRGASPSAGASPEPAVVSFVLALSHAAARVVESSLAPAQPLLAHQLRADVACAFNASWTRGSADTRVFIVGVQDVATGAWRNDTYQGVALGGAAGTPNGLPLAVSAPCDAPPLAPVDPGPGRYAASVPGVRLALEIHIPAPGRTAEDVVAGNTHGYERPADFWYSQAYRRMEAKAAAVAASVAAVQANPAAPPTLKARLARTVERTAAYTAVGPSLVTVAVYAPPSVALPRKRVDPLVPERGVEAAPAVRGALPSAAIGGGIAGFLLLLCAALCWMLQRARPHVAAVARRRAGGAPMSLDEYLKYTGQAKGGGQQQQGSMAGGAPADRAAMGAAAGAADSAWGSDNASRRALVGDAMGAAVNPLLSAHHAGGAPPGARATAARHVARADSPAASAARPPPPPRVPATAAVASPTVSAMTLPETASAMFASPLHGDGGGSGRGSFGARAASLAPSASSSRRYAAAPQSAGGSSLAAGGGWPADGRGSSLVAHDGAEQDTALRRNPIARSSPLR